MGFDKVLTPVLGVPLIRHTVEAFVQSRAITEIVVVCSPRHEGQIREAVGTNRKIRGFVPGGATRQESVSAGLAALGEGGGLIAVHDAARPLVTSALIESCVAAAIVHGAAAAAEPETDTLQRADESGRFVELVPRENLWRLQTPQVFRTQTLRRAMESVIRDGAAVTDETSALLRLGEPVFLVANSDWNFKVTVPRDVAVAEFILQSRAAASLV